MSFYRQTPVSGFTYRRSGGGTFVNPDDGAPPYIIFDEDELTVLVDGARQRQATIAKLRADYGQGRLIPLLDPATDIPTGQTVPEGLLYQLLYSLYWQLAEERDQALLDSQTPPDAIAEPAAESIQSSPSGA